MKVLRLPNQLLTIDEEAFAQLNVDAVIIPDGCRNIGKRAFADCEKLLYVRIPDSVEEIAEDAFDGCEKVILDWQK